MITKSATFLFLWVCFLESSCGFGVAEIGHTIENTVPADSSEYSDSATVYHDLRTSISKAKAGKNIKNLAGSYVALARYHSNFGHLDSALFCLKHAEAIYYKHGDKAELARTYLLLKEVYSLKGDNLEATNLVFKALEIYENNKDEKGIAECYSHLGEMLYYSDQLELSVEYSNKAIAIQKKLGMKTDLATSYYTKSCPQLFIFGQIDSALVSVNNSLLIYKEIGESGIPYLKAINWRGNIYKYMGRYDDALADYKSNLIAARREKINHYEMISIANIGHVYLLQEQYGKALPYNLEAIAIMKATGDTRNLWENYMHVATEYENLGQPDSALKYQKAYIDEYEDYLQSTIARLETEAQVKYDTRKKNETIITQSEELVEQERIQSRYILFASILFLFLLLLFISYLKRQKRNHQLGLLNDKLDAKNRQNELLMKEIHHRVKNNLEMVKSLLALQSAKTDDPASREAILAGQSRVQSMGIIHQKLYRGDKLDSIEMKDYFENLTEDILDSFQAGNQVSIDCDMEPLDLNIDTAIPIGLIVNELISNSLKYAFPDSQEGKIKLSLTQETDGLHLKVSDNGVGFTLGSAPKGTGFGSQLIDLLTRQLNGVLCKENETGTSLLFHFHPTKAA